MYKIYIHIYRVGAKIQDHRSQPTWYTSLIPWYVKVQNLRGFWKPSLFETCLSEDFGCNKDNAIVASNFVQRLWTIGWDQWLIQLHCLQTIWRQILIESSKVSTSGWRLASATHLGRRHDGYSGSYGVSSAVFVIFWCREFSVPGGFLKWGYPQFVHFHRSFC